MTEHRAHRKCCGHCGFITKANFPADVTQPAQYGAKAKSLMVYMHQYQLLPFDRNREFFSDVFSQDVSIATITSATEISYTKLKSAEDHIKQQLINGRLLLIRGYISTAKKQGVNVLQALQHAMQSQAILFNA